MWVCVGSVSKRYCVLPERLMHHYEDIYTNIYNCSDVVKFRDYKCLPCWSSICTDFSPSSLVLFLYLSLRPPVPGRTKARRRGRALTSAQRPGAALTSLKRSGRLLPPPLSCLSLVLSEHEAGAQSRSPSIQWGADAHNSVLGGDRVRIRIEKCSARHM